MKLKALHIVVLALLLPIIGFGQEEKEGDPPGTKEKNEQQKFNMLEQRIESIAENLEEDDESIDFTPIVEVNFQLEFHLTPHCTVFGGYDLFFAGQVSRPTDNLVYDSTAGVAGFSPTLRQNVILDDFLAHGLNLGAILTY